VTVWSHLLFGAAVGKSLDALTTGDMVEFVEFATVGLRVGVWERTTIIDSIHRKRKITAPFDDNVLIVC
jgi:hypothetical protein